MAAGRKEQAQQAAKAALSEPDVTVDIRTATESSGRASAASHLSLTPSEVARLEREVEAFEREWERGEPRLTEYLASRLGGPTDAAESLDTALAYELALVDLEHRLKRGQEARAEEYLGLHPALRGSGAFVREAVALEFALRSRADPGLDPQEYARRFPGLAAELPALLPGMATGDGTHGRGLAERLTAAERYIELAQIGRGGMGVVHRVHDTSLQRDVARKTLRSDAMPAAGRGEFVAEARISGQLDHPNIAPVHDIGIDAEGRPFFTMKLVLGETFTELLRRLHRDGAEGERLEPLLRVFLKVCDAVEFAHAKGVVHRDLKPQNVMVGTHGQVYVMDWGLSVRAPPARPGPADMETADGTVIAARGTNTGSIAGTVAYMAPEQAGAPGLTIGTWTDVFALGAILYEIVTGRAPYRSGTPFEWLRRAVFDPPERAATAPVPPGLCEIVRRAMQPEPAARYGSVTALREAVEGFLRGGGWFATRRFADAETIVREGDVADAAYVLTSGRCDVEQQRAGGPVRLRSLSVGDVFGEVALLGGGRRTATVRAVGPVEVKVVTADALARELDRSQLVKAVVMQLNRRLLELELERRGEARAE